MNTNLLKFVATASVALAIVLLVVQVVISNRVGMLGKKLTGLESNIVQEKLTNNFLATEVASASSMLAQGERARHLGFREATKTDILVVDTTVPVAFGGPEQVAP